MRIENEELQKEAMKHQIMTFEGERDNISNKLIPANNDDDKDSVCSCNCIGTSSENGQLIDGYLPTDLVNSSLSLKRASV